MHNTICIVDDDPIFVYTAKALMALEESIDQVVVCENGKEAFEFIQSCHLGSHPMPDLLLLDLNMPVWDGWNFLDEFKKLPELKLPDIYISTSSDHPEDLERATTYEFVKGFLTKPLTEEVLAEVLSKHNANHS